MNAAGVRLALAGAFTLVVAAALFAVLGHERTLAEGQVVLVELAPVDPRSLMQGDYMALAFAVDRDLAAALAASADPHVAPPRFVYLTLDDAHRASFAGVGHASSGQAGGVALRIRMRGRLPSVGPNAYFFEEGSAEKFEAARWGEFRVSPDGKALLTHLRDGGLERLE